MGSIKYSDPGFSNHPTSTPCWWTTSSVSKTEIDAPVLRALGELQVDLYLGMFVHLPVTFKIFLFTELHINSYLENFDSKKMREKR